GPGGRGALAPRAPPGGRAAEPPARQRTPDARRMKGVLGWDIGGVNTKVARATGTRVAATRVVPYEIQRDPAALAPLLDRLARELGAQPGDGHAVTMTAELSQLFRTKREGVAYVLDAVTQAFPDGLVRVYAVDGRWRTPDEARRDPLAVAAANWAATARLVARSFPDCILIDVGSTTTDIIPVVEGAPAAIGRTDPERLCEGELIYTGALRTPAEAIASSVPFRGRPSGVSAEAFALAVVPGLVDFLAREAARRAALTVTHLSTSLGPAARHAPAAAVALLLAAELARETVPS